MSDFEDFDTFYEFDEPDFLHDNSGYRPIEDTYKPNETNYAIYNGDDITSIHPLPDFTTSPKTPREAIEQSGAYKKIYDQIEGEYSNVLGRSQDDADRVRNELPFERKQLTKLIVKRDSLLSIKAEENSEARRYLLADYLDEQSNVPGEVSHFQYYLLRRSLYQPTVDVFGHEKETSESFSFQQRLIPVIRAGFKFADVDSFDLRQAYEDSVVSQINLAWEGVTPAMRERLLKLKAAGNFPPLVADKRSDFPESTQVSPETWEKIHNVIKAAQEFEAHEAGDEISSNLATWLDEWVDVDIRRIEEKIQLFQESIKALKHNFAFDDEEVARRARSLVDDAEHPIIDAAKTHNDKNLALLRRGAIAEAALDGVHIKTRDSRKKTSEESS